MTTLLALAAGAAIALGVLLIGVGLRRTEPRPPSVARRRAPTRWTALPVGRRRQIVAAIVGGLVAWAVTGWALALPAVPALVLGLPALLRPPAATSIARLEALQEWTRALAGLLTVGVGLEHALIASARSAPAPISVEVTGLAARLRARTPTEEALAWFAEALDDATADLIVLSLTRAATRRGQGLTAILESLASSVAHEVSIRRAVEAERAKLRTSARGVTAVTLIVMAALFATGDYVAPYRTAVGSAVLVMLLAAYIAVLAWLRRLGAAPRPARLITPVHNSNDPTRTPAGARP